MQQAATAGGWDRLIERLPVLGICGMSGSGKTTLIEGLIPWLHNMGLKVAVVKHGARRIEVDRHGKDSDRFFRAGADVFLWGEERFCRLHDKGDLLPWLAYRARCCDVLLVEGHASTPVPKLWLLAPGHSQAPEGAGMVRQVYSRDEAAVKMREYITTWLSRQWLRIPVWGCVLVGGQSRRMGRPKHLIRQHGRTWIEHSVDILSCCVEKIVLSGAGVLPQSLSYLPRIPDLPGDLHGPLAGLLSVMRWNPWVSWLPLACDQPVVNREALEWLLDQRHPGIWAVLPSFAQDGRVEPLLAHYDFRILPFLEQLAAGTTHRLGLLSARAEVRTPRPPDALWPCWKNINSPDELPHDLLQEEGDVPAMDGE